MAVKEQSVLHQRANGRVWAHLIFWNLIPLGWIISAIKTRSLLPVYIMLSAIAISGITAPKKPKDDAKTAFTRGYHHGRKIGAVASLVGSVVTENLIMDARNQIKN